MKKKSQLRQQIEESLGPRQDDEKEDDERESALIMEKDESDEGDEFIQNARTSTLRSKTGPKLADFDPRYRGKPSSRQSLQKARGDDHSSKDEAEHANADLGHMFELSDDGDSGEDEDISDDTGKGEDVSDDTGEEDDASESHIEAEGSESSKNGDDDMGSMFGSDDENDQIEEQLETQEYLKDKSSEMVRKGQAIKNQLRIWDKLLECRIQMQKLLARVNQCPQPDCWPSFLAEGDQQYKAEVKGAKAEINSMFDHFLHIQMNMLKKTSDFTEEMPEPPAKKAKLSEYSTNLGDRYEMLNPYSRTVIEKWNDKTRLLSGSVNSKSFSGFENTVLKQIEHVLTDKPRLIMRTQIKRTAYRVLGKIDDKDQDGSERDQEIFDDDDFYHQLLKELIDRKSSDLTDPTQLGRHWLQIQKMRAKSKKNIDTKASKGRKTRYDVHAKLVNFMAPNKNSLWSDDAKNELFSSLFGKANR